MMSIPTTALIILDGWGHRNDPEGNAIAQAATPVWDELVSTRPYCLISGSGVAVGLPPGQMGNSEVGHMNLGAGRVIHQDFTRISKSIDDGDFFDNAALSKAMAGTAQSRQPLIWQGQKTSRTSIYTLFWMDVTSRHDLRAHR
jgi:2,3-bisphosphoglycerate-independent phosphoglycerate mutase